MPKVAGLTDKQKRFCQEYAIDWNGTRAALAAGYSKESAGQIAEQNLKKHEIQAYLNEIRENLEKAAGLSALSVLMELKRVAFSNMANYKDGWETMKDFDGLTLDETAAISEAFVFEKKFDTGGDSYPIISREVKIKLHNKLDALEKIAKMLGYNQPDKVDHTTKGKALATQPPVIVFYNPDDGPNKDQL